MASLITCANLLSYEDLSRVAAIALGPGLSWRFASTSGRTARGRVYQLAGRDEHDKKEMHELRDLLVERVESWLQAYDPSPALKLPDSIVQVFPVLMIGIFSAVEGSYACSQDSTLSTSKSRNS